MRLASLALLLPVLSARAQTRELPVSGARDPAYAPDGRLALSVRGDLWIVSPTGKWSRVTSGAEWDREPSWSSDGKTLLFASNRGGNFDIWRVAVGDTGAIVGPTRVLGNGEDESTPLALSEGRVLFGRGRGSAARLWVREPNGTERRLTNGRAAERWPALSPDGRRVAFVVVAEAGRRLVVRAVDV